MRLVGPTRGRYGVSVAIVYADGVPVGLVGAIRQRPPRRLYGLFFGKKIRIFLFEFFSIFFIRIFLF